MVLGNYAGVKDMSKKNDTLFHFSSNFFTMCQFIMEKLNGCYINRQNSGTIGDPARWGRTSFSKSEYGITL